MYQFDPNRDLTFERVVPITREEIWAAWTQPELIEQWFTPLPWKTRDVSIEVCPGGAFHSVMCGPEGQEFPNDGCILVADENRKLVFTSCLEQGFRPSGGSFFTGMIELEDHPEGTLYRATVIHKDSEDQQKHAAMGFEPGWSKALDQLVELMLGKRA